jgi:MYXO-CTERM domain-containing protein
MTFLSRASLGLAALALTVPSLARAEVVLSCDLDPTLALADGSIGGGEYAFTSSGVGGGFGRMIGSGVEMYVDSNSAGDLAFGFDATGGRCVWGTDDTVVVYIDSIPNAGYADTRGFTDMDDQGRAATSGAAANGRADLFFAGTFRPDYAIAIRHDSASLFRLVAGDQHGFVSSLTRAPSGNDFAASCVKELDGISMADLGSQAGNPLRFVATLVNPVSAQGVFRSDEFQGIEVGPAANIGVAPYTFAAADGNRFRTNGDVVGVSGPFAYIDFATFAANGWEPMPQDCGRLSTQSWSVHGVNEAFAPAPQPDLPFGYTAIAPDTDLTRGLWTPSDISGGVYAFEHAPNDLALGVVPSTGDFTASTHYFELRVRNAASANLVGLRIRYRAMAFNDQPGSQHIELRTATGGSFTDAPAATAFVSPEAASVPPGWVSMDVTFNFPSFTIASGQNANIRWMLDDETTVTGARRDKIAIDDIVLIPIFSTCGNGVVDANEQCDAGAANGATTCACQSTCTFPASGTGCGAGVPDTCDTANSCDGAGACVDRVGYAGEVCRTAAGACDVDEVCDGLSNACPSDTLVADGVVCAPSDPALGCDADDTCTGSSATCPSSVAAEDTPCRASTGDCDLGASCDGVLAACPASVAAPAATPCRDATGLCDLPEECDGTSIACPANAVAALGTPCRDAAGVCDVAEQCDGANPACPVDAFANGTECRESTGVCDAAELCPGDSAECPADAVASAATVCRAAVGDCDAPESCDGTTDVCPADVLEPSTTVCRAAVGACDVSESCTGTDIDCPFDASAADGTACGDGTGCNGDETCSGGACTPGTAVDCDDGDDCTADSCVEPDSCENTPIADCCNDDTECDDGDPCTTDTCVANVCESAGACEDAGPTDEDGGPMDDDGGMIARDAGTGVDAGDGMEEGGCSCRAGASNDSRAPWLALGIVALFVFRRRRRAA